MKNISVRRLLKGLLLSSILMTSLVKALNHDELFTLLKQKDSQVFTLGFNQCDIKQFAKLVSDDFEFYHDKAGITESKQQFLDIMKDGVCKSEYQPKRELVAGSLQVFPLYNNGKLYGAIQNGEHQFYETVELGKTKHTSTAKFSHLWLLQQEQWKLARVLSFDHQVPE